MKSNMLVVLLQIGLCVGIQPLIGYNYGAGNKKRLMQVFKFTGIVSVVMGTILTLLMMAARKTLVQVFINDARLLPMVSRWSLHCSCQHRFWGSCSCVSIRSREWEKRSRRWS